MRGICKHVKPKLLILYFIDTVIYRTFNLEYIYPRLILDVDRYHRRHDSLELKKQLTHVVEQLAATAPDEFKTVSSVLDFLHMTSYAQVVNETHRGIIENVITHN